MADAAAKGRRKNTQPRVVDRALVLKRYNEGATKAQIARELGFHQTSIHRALLEALIQQEASNAEMKRADAALKALEQEI